MTSSETHDILSTISTYILTSLDREQKSITCGLDMK